MPHAEFVHAAFSNPETAAAFLQAYLDKELVALVDWASLHIEPGTFIDAQMKSSIADLPFKAKLHGKASFIPLRILSRAARMIKPCLAGPAHHDHSVGGSPGHQGLEGFHQVPRLVSSVAEKTAG